MAEGRATTVAHVPFWQDQDDCLHAFARAPSWAAGMAVVLSKVQSRLGAYRVSLAWRRGSYVALQTWTDVAPLDEGVGVPELELAAQEATEWTLAGGWPATATQTLTPGQLVAHRQLYKSQGLTGVLSAPIRDEHGLARGVLICERIPMLDEPPAGEDAAKDGGGFNADDRQWLQELVEHIGPVVLMRHGLEQPWYSRSWSRLGLVFARLSDPQERWLRGAVLTFFGVSAFLFGWPLSYTIDVPAQLVAQSETAVVAPADAVVMQSSAHVGELVRAGQVLAHLGALTSSAPRSQTAASDAAPDALVGTQLVEAPFDGVVIRQGASALAGSTVRRGDALWMVSPGLDWRVVLRVDERDIAAFNAGQHASMRLTGARDRTIHLLLRKPVPLAVEGAQKLQFELEAQVTGGAMAGLRPGMQGVASIDMPPKPMLRRAVEAVQRWWWLTWWGLW